MHKVFPLWQLTALRADSQDNVQVFPLKVFPIHGGGRYQDITNISDIPVPADCGFCEFDMVSDFSVIC